MSEKTDDNELRKQITAINPRVTRYSEEKAKELCSLVVAGWSLRRICGQKDMPALMTFFDWIRKYPDFHRQYAQAKEDQADVMVEEMLEIADDLENDIFEMETGKQKFNMAKIQRDRLRVDTRKWAASKFKAKKYGDRLIHAGDADAPLATKDVTTDNDRAALDRYVKTKYTKKEKDNTDYDDVC